MGLLSDSSAPTRGECSATMPIAEGVVGLWHASFAELAQWESRLEASLSGDERQRAARYRFPEDRQEFVLGRGLLRHLAGRYLALPPNSLRFGYASHGKPYLPAPIEFNIAHSGDRIVIAFGCVGRRLGVDIEKVDSQIEPLEIATGFFSKREVDTLQSLASDERRQAFFRCWVRKEAFLKALGDGLSRPLGDFDVAILEGEPPAVLRVAWDAPAPSRWHIHSLDIAPGYMGALCVEDAGCRIQMRNALEAL